MIGRNGYGYYTVQDLMHYLLYASDNTSYFAFWNTLGRKRYISLEEELGIPDYPERDAAISFDTDAVTGYRLNPAANL